MTGPFAVAIAVTALGLAISSHDASAQSGEKLVGT